MVPEVESKKSQVFQWLVAFQRVVIHQHMYSIFVALNFFFLIWPRHVAFGILVPRPGIEPGPSAVKVWSPNHWTAREVPVALKFYWRSIRIKTFRRLLRWAMTKKRLINAALEQVI